MTLEQRVAVLEEIFLKLQDYYMSAYSGEEIDALLASAGVPIGITKEYDSVSAMNSDFSGTDVTRGQFVLILPSDTSSEDYGKVYLKGTANWVYVFTLTSLTAIKGPQGPAGKRGAKGADGADGKNFMVLGYYETLSALNAAVPSPGTGDTYGVGTEPPYAFYMYDPTISNWRYVGNLQGPEGSQGEKGDKGDKGNTGATGPQGPEGPVGGASNFVRYDAAQTLTDEQKQQARTNIGADTVQGAVLYTPQSLTDDQKTQARGNIEAAPAGFGVGEIVSDTPTIGTLAELDATEKSGLYYCYMSEAIESFAYGQYGMVLVLSTAGVKRQYFFPRQTDSRWWVRQKTNYADTWGEWEFGKVPMDLGVEYRTTERYLGKPVYVKAVDFGALPNATTKTVTWAASGEVLAVLSVEATSSQGDPVGLGVSLSGTELTATKTTLYVKSSGDYSSNTAVFRIKYTKTTD